VQHQIAFTLPAQTGRTLAFVLSRGEDDFTDAERRFLDRARPFLAQAYRNALAARKPSLAAALRGAGLSARQAEVIALVAQGCSTRDAATELGLSFRTVQKHLEHAFRALGVTSRSAAAARAWELAAG
jgi:DNA-binding NarL/FixJ family response regulator